MNGIQEWVIIAITWVIRPWGGFEQNLPWVLGTLTLRLLMSYIYIYIWSS